jgi:rhodanese-related sulfurtransferase
MATLPLECTPAAAQTFPDAIWVDVREAWELEICSLPFALHIPLSDLPGRLHDLPVGKPVLVLCHHGVRSLSAVRFLRRQGYDASQSVAGGIDRWAVEVAPGMNRY